MTHLAHKSNRRAIQENAIVQARALLSAAILHPTESDNLQAIKGIPHEAWPDELTRATGIAVQRCNSAGVDMPTILAMVTEEGLYAGDAYASTLADEIVGAPATTDPERCARAIIEAHEQCKYLEATHSLRAALGNGMSREDLRHYIQDSGLLDGGVHDRIEIADVANAPEPEPGLYGCGIYRGKLNLALGESNSGKSFLLLHAAVGLAAGHGLLHPFTPRTPGTCLFLSGEDDAPIIRERLESIAERYGVDWRRLLRDGTLRFICKPTPFLEFDRDKATRTRAYGDLLREAEKNKPDFVVVDPASAWSGIQSYNENSHMIALATALIELAQIGNSAVLLSHHTSKQGSREMHQAAGTGSMSLQNAARWILNLRCLPNEDAVKYALNPRKFIEVAVTKNSYGDRSGLWFMQRVDGGVLECCNPEKWYLRRIACDIAEALGDEELTIRELVYRDTGRDIREAVQTAYDKKLTRAELARAIEYGLNPAQGFSIFREDEVTTEGRPKKVLKPCT